MSLFGEEMGRRVGSIYAGTLGCLEREKKFLRATRVESANLETEITDTKSYTKNAFLL